jgi:uncharacterized protein
VEFEWDEAKRASNIEKHGLDFLRGVRVFDGATLIEPAITVGGETRFAATGMVDGRLVTVIFTERGTARRIISVRRARHGEGRRYQALHG